jgi:hypothetical protein
MIETRGVKVTRLANMVATEKPEVSSENLKGRAHFENLDVDGRILITILKKYGVRCGLDSYNSELGQVAKPIEILYYLRNYVCIIFSKRILIDGVSSSVSKNVLSNSNTPY